MFASKCWELKRNTYQILEQFNTKAMKPLYFEVLNDLLLFCSVVSRKFDIDLRNYYVIQGARRRSNVILPEIRYEAQRLNFWLRTGFWVNNV